METPNTVRVATTTGSVSIPWRELQELSQWLSQAGNAETAAEALEAGGKSGNVLLTDLEKRRMLEVLDARVKKEGLPPALVELWKELRHGRI